ICDMEMNAMAVLFVRDAKKARDFYVDILGMTVTADFGEMNYIFKEGFALWQPMDENIIPRKLGAENIHNRDAASRFELCFEAEDIDEYHCRLKADGAKFHHEINEAWWGQRTIRFYDPDGHLIEIGEALPVFVGRIFEEESENIEATAKRAFMDPETVRRVLGV
ncbi:MAG: glyoxalase/bleomycin resistance/dioxygenase family protein, partial [Alistipes sp.]|nr:glyoxalase/bleomycin resistance/dioxygenase family protein [Alistipes sp.]